jgi:hypothetical protein
MSSARLRASADRDRSAAIDTACSLTLDEADAGVQQRADAERGDPVAELVQGGHAAGHRGGHRGQVALAEADGQRQQRRAAQPG